MTAREFFKEVSPNNKYGLRASLSTSQQRLLSEIVIRFAKIKVTEALQAASENADADFEPMGWLAEQHLIEPFVAGEDYEIGIHRNSILNAYPLDLIK